MEFCVALFAVISSMKLVGMLPNILTYIFLYYNIKMIEMSWFDRKDLVIMEITKSIDNIFTYYYKFR